MEPKTVRMEQTQVLGNKVTQHPYVCIPVSAVGGCSSAGALRSASWVGTLPGRTYTGLHMDRQTPQPVPSTTELVKALRIWSGRRIRNEENFGRRQRENMGNKYSSGARGSTQENRVQDVRETDLSPYDVTPTPLPRLLPIPHPFTCHPALPLAAPQPVGSLQDSNSRI